MWTCVTAAAAWALSTAGPEAGAAPPAISGVYAAGPGSVLRGDRDFPEVALTFDGGSEPTHGDRILETLRRRRLTCTFFLTGGFIRRNPQFVRRVAEAGHEVANHGWRHVDVTREPSRLLSDLARTAREFHRVTGSRMARLWRAPYGRTDRRVLTDAWRAGWVHVEWTHGRARGESLDLRDWGQKGTSSYLDPEEGIRRVLAHHAGAGATGRNLNGAIVLLHLSSRNRFAFVLEELIELLEDRGYRIVTVSRVLNGAADRAS